ncbi:MAG: hypothetical protein ACOVP5_02305, partial [Chitinophagales bacterium]
TANFYTNHLGPVDKYMLPYWVRYDYLTQPLYGTTFQIDSTIKWESIEWQIGSERIQNEPKVFRTGFPEGASVPVTLIVRRTPDKSCFPNDDGVDTLTKFYKFTKSQEALIGKFRGKFIDVPDMKDTFEFETRKGSYKGSIRDVDTTYPGFSIKTFPFSGCEYLIHFRYGLVREDYGNGFARTDCQSPDPKRNIASAYIRYIDNSSNNIELKINLGGKGDFPAMTWRGHKIK